MQVLHCIPQFFSIYVDHFLSVQLPAAAHLLQSAFLAFPALHLLQPHFLVLSCANCPFFCSSPTGAWSTSTFWFRTVTQSISALGSFYAFAQSRNILCISRSRILARSELNPCSPITVNCAYLARILAIFRHPRSILFAFTISFLAPRFTFVAHIRA